MTVRAFVHPTCTSCKKAEEFLTSADIAYDRRDFFRDRLTIDELREVLDRAGVAPTDILSRRSRVYKARSEEIDAMTDDELLAAMVAEPTLIRRPLILDDDRLIVGFDKKGLAALAEQSEQTG